MRHPGLQTTGATIVLDLVFWITRKSHAKMRLLMNGFVVIVLNVVAIIAVSLNNVDPFEEWVTSLYLILTILLLLVHALKRT